MYMYVCMYVLPFLALCLCYSLASSWFSMIHTGNSYSFPVACFALPPIQQQVPAHNLWPSACSWCRT